MKYLFEAQIIFQNFNINMTNFAYTFFNKIISVKIKIFFKTYVNRLT